MTIEAAKQAEASQNETQSKNAAKKLAKDAAKAAKVSHICYLINEITLGAKNSAYTTQ